eukprot:871966-Alexandrium_andersonii.AAC.1
MAGSSHEDPWYRREATPKVSLRPRRNRSPRDQRGPAVRPPGIRAGDQHDQWQALATGRDLHGP